MFIISVPFHALSPVLSIKDLSNAFQRVALRLRIREVHVDKPDDQDSNVDNIVFPARKGIFVSPVDMEKGGKGAYEMASRAMGLANTLRKVAVWPTR